MMLKRLGLIGLLIPASCQLSSAERSAIVGVGNLVARYECARLSPDVALDMLCTDAAGVAITVAEAKANGLLATKRVIKG